MPDSFLEQTGVTNESRAMQDSLQSALGRNKVYSRDEIAGERAAFRTRFAELIRATATEYAKPVSDEAHCAAITNLSDTLSYEFSSMLRGGRLRYGTAQKALNLYLKYLWRLGRIPEPPHCPVDSIVLNAGAIDAKWTESDNEEEYKFWIKRLRWKAQGVRLGKWELDLWSRATSKQRLCR